ncbi:MAG: TrkH family potassium uptake protein [Gammaproteobacteria bacterium]|jgi:trk system potassium uptake protein TrkH
MASHFRPVFSIAGLLCILFSFSVVPAIFVSWYYQDGEIADLFVSFILILFAGVFLWLLNHDRQINLRSRDGFLVVTVFWLMLGVLGALPFKLALNVSAVDALFESVSGLTTTGATVFSNLDTMQPSILFYRQELQWFGGMGLIVLAVAVLPMLGIGGMSLYRAEIPGPMKDDKIMPRLYMGSRILWLIYVGLTAACALAYWLAGMSTFDAISHSLTTVSTGGFSTHDASLAYFESEYVDDIAVVFMLLGSINFGVHYTALHTQNLNAYFKDKEVQAFVIFVVAAIAVVAVSLWWSNYSEHWVEILQTSIFEVVSIVTTTGYGIADFSIWPIFLPFFLILISFVGGCGGSTAGGVKVMRMDILIRLGYREILRLVHQKGIFPVKIGGKPVASRTLQSILGFFSLYIASFVVLLLMLLVTTDVDQITAFSAIATCINNTGPGLRDVALSFSSLNDSGKMISVAAMLLGRLEIFSILVLFHPEFWRS